MSGDSRRIRVAATLLLAGLLAAAAAPPPEMAAVAEAVAASGDPVRQIQAIDALGQLGAPGSRSTARDAARADGPALLLGIVRDPANDWSVRGEALTTLRTIDAPDLVVHAAIAAARADTGDHAGYLQARAIELLRWSDTRANKAAPPSGDDADAKRRATLMLRQHDLHVDTDALTQTVQTGRTELVGALLTAGLPVSGPAAPAAMMAVVNALATACEGGAAPDGMVAAIDLLLEAGLPVDLADAQGNTLLMSAAQFCPAPVAAGLLAAGASPGPVNKQRFTPLQMALVSGKWDVAAVLVDGGARITKQQASQLFFEPPQKREQRELLDRASR